MPKATVDGREVEFEPGMSVLQVCELAGKEIPRFCYHERLSIAGNCRMCLVEIKGGPPKPAASCAMPAAPDMVIRTDTPMVKKAREGVMEFLLINHPLDCPICDQGGECDLQDQAMAYGLDGSRYRENKRAVEDKYMGPLIKTIMTRCIHCTRCVRFASEVAGVDELGAIGRGEDMEITTYLEQALASELSGNVIDLCPVGALTSKPYAFTARPWELKKTESIDVMDAVGANIRVDARGREVMRILPRLNEEINEEWLTDKARYIFDGLGRQRLDQPYVRRAGRLEPCDWDEALGLAAEKIKSAGGAKTAAIVGDLAGVEAVYALRQLMAQIGSPHLDCRQSGAKLPIAPRAAYLFNPTIEGAEHADAALLIGTNPRREAPLINTRLRKRWLHGSLKVGLVGAAADLTYDADYLGAGPATLKDLADGKHPFLETLKGAERPMILVGEAALARPDGLQVLKLAARIAMAAGALRPATDDRPAWNGWAILHQAAARAGALDVGFVPGEGGLDTGGILAGAADGRIDVVYLLGADELDIGALDKPFVIYQGSHGDRGALAADLVLPGAAFTEQPGLYVNLEGRVQEAARVVFPPGEAKEDWAIVRALSGRLGEALPFDSLAELRQRLFEGHPHLAAIGELPEPGGLELDRIGEGGPVGEQPFADSMPDYYLTNPIARASRIMADCSRLFTFGKAEAKGTGTDG